MVAVILAGGRGSRLLPHTADIPKALVSVGGKPVVGIVLERLKKAGVTTAHLAVHYRAEQIMSALGDGSDFGIEIRYSLEEEPLSTVGPLKLIENLPEQFVVMNADVLTDLNVRDLYEFHGTHNSSLTVATYRANEMIDFGVIETDSEGTVTGFHEKPRYPFLVSMGIYVFSRHLIADIPNGTRYGFDDLMHAMLSRKESVATFPYDGYWLDIGRPADYERAARDFTRGADSDA